ncbi:hypothetical protein EZV62_026357 [Acer yangbiense]|uniref:Uncharacterized protein n=1 Tax=Acer yangbiense TaxID=1000413 RepID=A0A5C7GR44_9ROSI|nr:hypothetical protein EZV62_026357 [Acer yangbiense]
MVSAGETFQLSFRMDLIKQKWKKTLFSRTWECCKSLDPSSNKSSGGNSLTRSKTWHCTTPEKEKPNKNKCQVA